MTGPETEPAGPPDQWSTHWKRFSKATEANPGQALRRRLIIRLLGPDAAGPEAAILDFGCGSGDLLAEMAGRFPRAAFAGVDLSQSGLAVTAEKLPSAMLRRFDFAAPDGPPEELLGWATHVICSEVLEHVDDPAPLLANAARCLKPGGRLVVTVPGGPITAFDRHIGHRRHFTRARLRDMLERAGFEVEVSAGAGFPAFNLYRMAVLLRGRRLIEDISGPPRLLARSAMALFGGLMRVSLFDTPWGWQIVAAARKGE